MRDESNELLNVLRSLREEGIPFIILRGYGFLTDVALDIPSELDIIIPSEYTPKIRAFFRKHRYYEMKYFHSRLFTRLDGCHHTVHVYTNRVYARNMECEEYEEIASGAVLVEGFACLAGIRLAAHLVINCIIDKKHLPLKHIKTIKAETEKAGYEALSIVLNKHFMRSSTDKILNLIRQDRFKDIEKKGVFFLSGFILKRPSRIAGFIKYITKRLADKSILPSRGAVVAFTGTDGVGKTTLCRSLLDTGRLLQIRMKYIYMGRVRKHVLPMASVAKRVGISQAVEKGAPSLIYLLLRDSIYTLDMFLRYVFYILPFKLFGYVVLCDRYSYDIMLDKNHTFISEFFLKYLYPSPDILYYLDLSDEEIIKRKNEYDAETRQYISSRTRETARVFKAKRIVSTTLAENRFEVYEDIYEKYFSD